MLKDAIDLQSLRRVLVTKLRHHGDVLLTSPVFSVLKNHGPHLEIDALVYQDTAEMLTLHPAISQVHTVDRNWKKLRPLDQLKAEWTLLAELQERDYDLVVHLTDHNRGAWLKRLTGARWGVACEGRKGRFWKNSFSHFYPLPRGNARHTVEMHLDALRRIGIYPTETEKRLVFIPGTEAEASIDLLLAANGLEPQKFIHLHPASRWSFKCWEENKVAELVKQLRAAEHRIVLTAAPSDDELAMVRRIIELAGPPVVDLSGKLSLKQLGALTARAKLFIGVDSAPMHLAAAMGTPTVALFGPSGDIEWGPWMTPNRIITSDHPCRPCGNDGCGGGKMSECLTAISVETVLDSALGLLNI
ncbi:MAG: putative lipopolysaccharide heptosyltransferase III [Sulfuricellaceae bacterium]|jgi:heptosyltransferase-3